MILDPRNENAHSGLESDYDQDAILQTDSTEMSHALGEDENANANAEFDFLNANSVEMSPLPVHHDNQAVGEDATATEESDSDANSDEMSPLHHDNQAVRNDANATVNSDEMYLSQAVSEVERPVEEESDFDNANSFEMSPSRLSQVQGSPNIQSFQFDNVFQYEDEHSQQEELQSHDEFFFENDPDDGDDYDDPNIQEEDDYFGLLHKLGHLWLAALVNHDISIIAASYLWKIAFELIPKIILKKNEEHVRKKTPQFLHLRRKLTEKIVPPIWIRVAYLNLETNECHAPPPSKVVNIKAFSDCQKFKKLYEITSVSIKDILKLHTQICTKHQGNILDLSCDGVASSRSSSTSLDVFTVSFPECANIYPLVTIRPEDKKSFNFIDELSIILEDFKKNNVKIRNVIADNPMRALLRNCKNHSSYFSCEYCRGSAVYYEDPENVREKEATKKLLTSKKRSLEKEIFRLQDRQGSDLERSSDGSRILSLLEKRNNNEQELEVSLRRKKKVFLIIFISFFSCSSIFLFPLQTHLIWPAESRLSELRTIERITETVANIDDLSLEEKEGVIGYSPLMDYEGFNFILGIPIDYMHHVCLGVVKRLIELTFNVGDNRKRLTKRKLSLAKDFNDVMLKTKVPSEFSRRGRTLDLKVMKGEEMRNIVLFFFPIVLLCIKGREGSRERQLWLILAFQIRAYVLPSIEYHFVNQRELSYCCNKFITLFQDIFGKSNSSYNIHMMSHLSIVRERGPLTETSTFKTESYYSEMRRSYVAGTASTGKQILQNAFVKRSLPHESCSRKLYFKAEDTKKSCNKYAYIFRNGKFEFYLLKKKHEDNSFSCVRQGKREFTPDETPFLNWSNVGVFLRSGEDHNEVILNSSDFTGKAIVVAKCIITCPSNVLKE